jgi:hypothetical protein
MDHDIFTDVGQLSDEELVNAAVIIAAEQKRRFVAVHPPAPQRKTWKRSMRAVRCDSKSGGIRCSFVHGHPGWHGAKIGTGFCTWADPPEEK